MPTALANGVQIDTITGGNGGMQATGDVARQLLQSGFNVNALRTCDVLRKDEWIQFDERLIEIAHKRLVAVAELMSRGLTYNIPNGLGTTQLEWERVSDMEGADVSMSGVTDGQRDRQVYDLQTMPLPIIHKDFNVNIRALEASRKRGIPLDTAQADQASRLVSETVEAMVFNGHTVYAGGNIYGLANHPDRNTGVASDWELTATTGANKLADVLEMIAAAQDDNMYGPYGIFVSQTAYTLLAEDYKAESDKTQLQRLLEVPGIEFIKPSKDITDGSLFMVQLSSDVIDEVIGMQPTVVQWSTNGGMTVNFKVMAIMIPRVRSTQSGQSGVVHFTP